LYTVPLQPGEKDVAFSKGAFSPVANTTGQVWNLSEVNGSLLMGHHEGAFAIKDDIATLLTNVQGCWLFSPLASEPSKDVLMGTYTGLQLLSWTKGQFEKSGKIDGLTESLRFLAIDENYIWASHPYRGVFRIELSADKQRIVSSTLYTDKEGLPSLLNNYVFRIKNKIVVTTEKGIYEYDAITNRFILSRTLHAIFNNMGIRRLAEDSSGNIWFVSNQHL